MTAYAKPLVLLAAFTSLAGFAALQVRPEFEPAQPELFALGAALVNAWADYDNDGDLDLFVGFNSTPTRLYQSDGSAFTDVSAGAGLAISRGARAAAWGDFDTDGDADLLIGFAPAAGVTVLKLFRNDAGTFGDVTQAAHITGDSGAVRQTTWVDFDADGDLDLFVAFRDRSNQLWLNENGTFTNVAARVGLADKAKSVGAVWFDYDEDADLDLVVGNMDGDANALYRNTDGMFTSCQFVRYPPNTAAEQKRYDSLKKAVPCLYEHAGESPSKSELVWGGRAPNDAMQGTVRPCAADVDGDGHLDLFFANYGGNGLFLNRGEGKFEDAASAWGITQEGKYDSCALDDFDNDGTIDLYVNGTVTGGISYRDYLLRNAGRRFEDVTPDNIQALQADHGVQWADFDRDGDADLALTGSRADGKHQLFRNLLADDQAAKSLSVLVVDGKDRLTRAGAEVRVYATNGRKLLGTRLVDAGSGYNAQSQMPVHFGLGDAKLVDVEATYPMGDKRLIIKVSRVDPARYKGNRLVVRIPQR